MWSWILLGLYGEVLHRPPVELTHSEVACWSENLSTADLSLVWVPAVGGLYTIGFPGRISVVTERKTLLGILWDRQHPPALNSPISPPNSDSMLPGSHRSGASLGEPTSLVDTRRRGEAADSDTVTATPRGEATAAERPRPWPPDTITRARGESVHRDCSVPLTG